MPGDYYRPHKNDSDYFYRPDYKRLTLSDVSSPPVASQPKPKESSPSQHRVHRSPPAKIKIDLKSAVPRSKGTKQPITSDHSKGQRTTPNMVSSASRSSNYSPPSPSVPEAPKALRCDTTKSEATSKHVARKLSTDLSISHCSSSHSPIVAPWNNHQAEMTVLGDDDDDDCPARRARITPSTDSPLPKFIDRCDNYGCNSFHSHFNCPLEKKCWGCRSKNHFTSDCPMTCTNCCSEGHISKHCEDFEMDPYTGIARPRRSFKAGSSANTVLPALSQGKIYQCDNYACRDLHSHWDCPLPAICWGCRSSEHFWSGCRERCGKCGAHRHISKYCDEFEMLGNGMSRPIRRPDDIATNTMKRKRESEMQKNGTQHSQGFERAVYPTPTPTSRYASTPLKQPPAKHCTSTPRHEYGEFTTAGSSSKVHTESLTDSLYQTSRTPLAYMPITRETFPSRTYDENGNKIYCTFWLRTGRCAFEATPRGCTLKHKIPPDEATQREIGINISAPWLRNDPVVQELEHERQSRRSSGPFDNPLERTGEREPRREPAYTYRERIARPSPTGMRPSSRESRPYPDPSIQAAFRSNKWLRHRDQNPEPARPHANTSNSSLREPSNQQQLPRQSVREFFQSLGPPTELPESHQECRTSTPTKSKPAAIMAESCPQKTSASAHTPILQKSGSPKSTVLKEEGSSQESINHKLDIPKPELATSTSKSTVDESMSAKMKAFEEEEYFKRKRHEAEMARKAEEQRLEYEHELRMVQLRKLKQG